MRRKISLPIFFILICILLCISHSCKNSNKKETDKKTTNTEYTNNKGEIFSTFYSITYLQPEGKDLHEEIKKRLHEFEYSLSPFIQGSIISRINSNDKSVKTDDYFEKMYTLAQQVSEKTNGAFDITVAPLVNAWGFGFGNHKRDKTPNIDSLLSFVGYKKIRLEGNQIQKEDPRTMLDASAIAKGYSSDIIGLLLEENGCENYMVEIGGEIVCKGKNPKGNKWKIGIDVPKDDLTASSRELQAIVEISNIGLATSGNYRKFYYRDEQKYSHTIDPRTGYPVNHNLLSTTVIAPTCMQADAYATAFMVLGIDSALLICNSTPNMDCYLIYADENGKLKEIYTEGFAQYFTKK